jgi:molybdate transport system ATP-binding protein
MSERIQASFVKRFPSGPEIRADSLLTGERARVTVLFGPSGAGKTTILRCLAGLLRPEEGQIRFGEKTWSNAAEGLFLPARKRRVGFVPQDYALFPHLSVEKNLGYGLRDLRRSERGKRVAEMIAWLGLAGLEERLPHELSGGQQQRVALGRAVARRPGLLLLDEPLTALDAPTRARLRGELRQLLKDVGAPTVLVTHDRADALALGDELVVMDSGKIVQQGSPSEVFSRPANLSVAGIVAVETVRPGKVLESGELITIAVGDRKLTAVGPDLPAGVSDVFVCIRAEDVILIKGDAIPKGSPRNSLPAVVLEFTSEGPMVRVELDCGFLLAAILTKQACEELALKKGDRVLALVKAPSVHLIPRSL